MPHEQVVELVRLAASAQAGDRTELFARLSGLIPASSQLRIEAIVKFFQLLGEAPVEESQLPDRFAQIAEEHRRLLEEVRSFRVNDPEVQALRRQAATALEIGDHTTASARLEEARLVVSRKRETLARVLNDQKREEAALVFEQGRVESARELAAFRTLSARANRCRPEFGRTACICAVARQPLRGSHGLRFPGSISGRGDDMTPWNVLEVCRFNIQLD